MIAIIGGEGNDPTGAMYDAALRARDMEVEWFDMPSVADSIATPDGRSLNQWLDDDPFLLQAPVHDFSLAADAPLRRAEAAILVDYLERYLVCKHILALVVEAAGIIQPNRPESVRLSGDKWATHEKLSAAGLVRPRASLMRNPRDAERLGDDFGYPLVVKDRASTQGRGVRLAQNRDELIEWADDLDLEHHPLLVEQYIECDAKDKRVLVVDGAVLGGMQRLAVPGDFRANLSLGGSIGEVGVADDEARLALAVVDVMGLSFGGIDIGRVTDVLPGREQLAVGELFCVETNADAGLNGFYAATGIDGAGEVIDLLRTRLQKEV